MRRQALEVAIAALLFAGLVDTKPTSNPAPEPQPQPVQPDTLPEPIPDPVPDAEPEPLRHAVIEFYTMPNGRPCPGCDAFKTHIGDLTSKGWTVETKPGVGMVPYFYLWLDGKRSSKIEGYMSMTRLRQRIAAMKNSGASAYGQSTTGQGSSQVRVEDARRFESASPALVRRIVSMPYTPRWTWPGSLRSHLQGYPHNIDTTGMTQDDMERLHDSLHDQARFTTRPRIVRRG